MRHPILTWTPITWAQGYRVEIDDDSLFGSPFQADVDADTLGYTVETELPDGMYYWRVQAKKNAAEWGKWSAIQTIVVSAP